MARGYKYAAEGQRMIEDELRARYGGSLTLVDIRTELGVNSAKTAQKWVDGMRKFMVNGRARYRASDVAERMFQDMR